MFNKQLNKNIKDLDLQIGILSKEIEDLQIDCEYEMKMCKLETLTELRVKLANGFKEGDNRDSIHALDDQIETLVYGVNHLEKDDCYLAKLKKLDDLVKLRVNLMDSKVKASLAPHIISGAIGIGAMVLVLRYEKAEVVTSKAFGLVTRLFRG